MIDLAEITHKIIILSSFRHPPSYTDELTQFLKNDPFDNQYKALVSGKTKPNNK